MAATAMPNLRGHKSVPRDWDNKWSNLLTNRSALVGCFMGVVERTVAQVVEPRFAEKLTREAFGRQTSASAATTVPQRSSNTLMGLGFPRRDLEVGCNLALLYWNFSLEVPIKPVPGPWMAVTLQTQTSQSSYNKPAKPRRTHLSHTSVKIELYMGCQVRRLLSET